VRDAFDRGFAYMALCSLLAGLTLLRSPPRRPT
jgi:hypothetical protein